MQALSHILYKISSSTFPMRKAVPMASSFAACRTLTVRILALALCICLSTPVAPLLAAPQSASIKKEARKKDQTKSSSSARSASKTRQPAQKSGKTRKKSGEYDVKATITLDLTRRRVLHEQNADFPIPPASLTKVLTMFIIMDRVKSRKSSLNEQVTVSFKAAATGGSHMGLHPGEKLPLQELLKGMAVASGNDAAVAVAQHVAGNEAAFVRQMNAKAKQLGMRNSVFKNVHGLPAKGQQTTARDMLTMTTKYLDAHPETLALFHTQRYLSYRGYTPNTNPLLGMDGVDGLKTGYVGASGYNLITTARRGNTRLVNVLLGAPSKSVRLHEATKLVETGFVAAQAQAAKDEEATQTKGARKNPGKSTPKKKTKAASATAEKKSTSKGSVQAQKASGSSGKRAAKDVKQDKPQASVKNRDASPS